MQQKKTRSELADQTRADIIDVATAEFVDKGLAGARIDVIAAKTQSSKRMIYYYFGSKDDLYRAVLEQAYANIRAAERTIDIETMDATAGLRTLVAHTFNYHHRHPEFVRLVMNENILHGAHIEALSSIKDRNRDALSTIRALLDKGVAEGVFREGLDPLAIHLTMSAMCFYNQSNRYTLRAGFGIDLADEGISARRREEIADAVVAYVRR